jgi:hypothetical protein
MSYEERKARYLAVFEKLPEAEQRTHLAVALALLVKELQQIRALLEAQGQAGDGGSWEHYQSIKRQHESMLQSRSDDLPY